MTPRRVLIFSLSYFPRFVGGAEVAVKEVADRIAPTDIEFDMITLGDGTSPSEEQHGNVRVHRIMKGNGPAQKFLYPFAAYRKARRMTGTARYDAVWAVMASYAGFAAYLLKRCRPGLPVLLTVQEGDNFERRQFFLWKPWYRKIFAAADRIQVISTYLSAWSRSMGASCPIDIIPNGADLALFGTPVAPVTKQGITQKLGKKPDDVFLITTSRLVLKNGVGDVIAALQHLPQQVKFLILGAGPLETQLKQQSLRLGLTYTDEPPVNPGNRVHFLGYIPHKDMPAYLAASEIFVRPSLTEGQGASFIEAMAAGLPVIATHVGGIPDFLTDGETGLVCEVANPKSIAEQVEKLMKDRDLRDRVVKKARTMVKAAYDWDAIAARMGACFHKTISRTP